MLKKYSFIYMVALWINISECKFEQRQKMIISLSKDLFVKNIILLKNIDAELILFTKILSRYNIYTSFFSIEEMQIYITNIHESKEFFSKTLILSLEEKFNDEILELISKNEMNAWKFSWLVWNHENRSLTRNQDFYIPYNVRFLNVKENNVSYMSEIYHPRLFSKNLIEINFGIWSENKGIEIFEMDLYKRRFKMNGTDINMIIQPVSIILSKSKTKFVKYFIFKIL